MFKMIVPTVVALNWVSQGLTWFRFSIRLGCFTQTSSDGIETYLCAMLGIFGVFPISFAPGSKCTKTPFPWPFPVFQWTVF